MSGTIFDYSHYFWQGNKIRLRALTIDDANHKFAQSLDSISREEFNIGIELPTTVESQKAWLEQYSGCKEISGMIAFAIETHEQDYVGLANMHSIDERHGKFSFSVIVNRPYRKQGYAEDTVRLIMKYGFLERRLHKCNSSCASYNTASTQLHQKLGLSKEGSLREERSWNGKHHDEVLFGMTLTEYNALDHTS